MFSKLQREKKLKAVTLNSLHQSVESTQTTNRRSQGFLQNSPKHFYSKHQNFTPNRSGYTSLVD